MIVDRLHCVRGLLASMLAVGAENNPSAQPSHQPLQPTPSVAFHPPPPGVNYEDNGTVFGNILRGEQPATVYAESDTLLTFRDRTPRAPLHLLVIPKQFIKSIRNVSPDDIDLVASMKEMALDVIEREQPTAYQSDDFVLCFHVPPFNSVDHLHLHVLAPATEMDYIMRYGKYRNGTPWCIYVDDALGRLKIGKSAV
mmetsp:Transcript_14322/g.30787  ORF Transcript_14322/g.30787 Transcript_14322/m.30787 type:complete len:197 (-) Transcript_14322:3406-3996(-)